MKLLALSFTVLAPMALFGCGGGGHPAGNNDGGGGPVSDNLIFPSDNPWNEDISGEAVDPDSDAYIAAMAPTTGLHPDFSNVVDGNYGIPYVVVPDSQMKVMIDFNQYPAESDPGPYAIPANAPIEGDGQGDAHVIAVDTTGRYLYELYAASFANGTWTAGCGAIFNLASNTLRPEGWTSADAAGLPIFPGLVRADDVITKGAIKHALRFTMVKTQAGYVTPARHFASNSTDATLPPMGLRVRLKSSVDISGAGTQAKIILQALKTYGMFVADNGSNWFVSGAPDARWDDDDLHTIGMIHGSDFEVVKHGTIGTLQGP
jgi:hypothetical protein